MTRGSIVWHSLRTWPRRLQLALALAVCLGAGPAQSDDLPEYRLKAAFLYNFSAFTEWPATVGTTLNLCVVGPDPFAAEIDPLNGKNVGSRKIEIQRKAGLDTLKDCQIVFVSAASIGQLPRVVENLRGLPALIVADSPGAARQGVMLNMNLVQGRVTFEANQAAALNARLALSSKLLRLATEVIQ